MISQCIPISMRQGLAVGTYDLSADVMYIAFYGSTASLDSSTTAYSSTGEASGSGYTAGGILLAKTVSTSNSTYIVDFADLSLSGISITARGALIYNSSKANAAMAILDFGSDKTFGSASSGIVWPAADSDNAILRIA